MPSNNVKRGKQMKITKIFSVILALTVLLALVGCTSSETETVETEAAPATTQAAPATIETEPVIETEAPAETYVETVVNFDVPETDGIPAHTVPGTLTTPAAEGKYPAVVMLHGTGSNRDEAGGGYAIAAPIMAEKGVVTLRIDFMGNGDSTANYSDYNYTSANLDAKAAYDYLATLDCVDAEKVAVLGWSQGGTNALLAAAAYPEAFHAVITWAGALRLDDDVELFGGKTFAEAKEIADTEGAFEMPFEWRDSLMVGPRWFEEVENTDVLAEVGKITVPVLAINGAADTTVDPSNAQAIADACGGTVKLLEGVDHTYNVFSGDLTALYETVDAGVEFLLSVFAD